MTTPQHLRGEAIAARARGDHDTERRTLDQLAALGIGDAPFTRPHGDIVNIAPGQAVIRGVAYGLPDPAAPRYSPVDGATAPDELDGAIEAAARRFYPAAFDNRHATSAQDDARQYVRDTVTALAPVVEARVRAQIAAEQAAAPVQWGVEDTAGRVIACESRDEAEGWLDDEDAWNPGESRWLVSRPTVGWSRVARGES